MLIRDIELVNERVHIHFFDVDGSSETMVLYPAEALDIYGWLHMKHNELLHLNEKRLHDIRREETV